MKQWKVGILGAGKIAGAMAETLLQMPNALPYAIASRDKSRAENFAQKYGIEKAYGSYEELANDPDVQLIYIASPHSEHAEHAKLCLLHDKPVLCEKAFTATAQQAKEIIALSEQRKVFLGEAMWTRFLPLSKTLQQLLADGVIGKPVFLSAALGDQLSHIQRLHDPILAGGALLDLGIYPLTFSSITFGNEINSVKTTATLFDTGVDATNDIILNYANSTIANIKSSMTTILGNYGIIYGEKGKIEVDTINNFSCIRVYRFEDRKTILTQTIECPPQITGYEYEVDAAIQAIQNGKLECEEIPHSLSLHIMQLMDDLRHSWGYYFDFEKKD